MKIVVLGSVNADLVVTAERAPDPGETLPGLDFHVFAGGKGANQAVGAARLLPGSVEFLGALGSDAFASDLRDSLTQAGVRLDGLATTEGSSGVALITVEPTGENRIVVVPGANASVTGKQVEAWREQLTSADILLLQLETPLDGIEYAASTAAAAGAVVILDPAPAQPLAASLLAQLTWLTPNWSEACALTHRVGVDDSETGIAALLEDLARLGCRNVLLKLGRQGLGLALASGERYRLAAFAVQAVDTTAAGDALNAGFAVALADGLAPLEAARWASAVAALSVTRAGAQPSMPTRPEVEAFLAARAGMDLRVGEP